MVTSVTAGWGTALAQQLPPATAFRSVSFGVNVNDALQNPLDGSAGEEPLRRQVAVLMHDLRATGATTARWFVDDVWPQWRASSDPEDQTSGEIDPGWFAVARVLLESAQANHVKVVVVLGDLADNSMGFDGLVAHDLAKRDATLRQWAAHRQAQAGHDGYADIHTACLAPPGYYGATQAAQLFERPNLRAHLARRDAAMARFLAQYPALGAIELFNEPPFALTATPGFWQTVEQLRTAVRYASPSLAQTPILSGVAWWSAEAAKQAAAQGVLAYEPFATVHSYQDYREGAATPAAKIQAMLEYTRRLVPAKRLVLAEAASSTALPTPEQNREMVRSLLDTYVHEGVGVWVWGSWFDPAAQNYRWTFNDRSPAGEAFRPFFFNVQKEGEYQRAKPVSLSGPGGAVSTPVTVGKVLPDDPNPARRGLFVLQIGATRLMGFSRAGVFPQPFVQRPELFAAPPETYFLSEPGEPLRWACIAFAKGDWTATLYASADASDGTPTPDLLLGLAETRQRSDFAACRYSKIIAAGSL